MCNDREDRMPERRRDWIASAAWAIIPTGVLASGALAAATETSTHRQAWMAIPFVFPAALLYLALAIALPGRWADWLAETLPEPWQVGLLALVSAASWWALFTLLAHPVCRAWRVNRTFAGVLKGSP